MTRTTHPGIHCQSMTDFLGAALVDTSPKQSCGSLDGPIAVEDQTKWKQVVQKSESGTSSIEAMPAGANGGPVCHPGFFFGTCYGSNLQFEVKYGPERPAICCSCWITSHLATLIFIMAYVTSPSRRTRSRRPQWIRIANGAARTLAPRVVGNNLFGHVVFRALLDLPIPSLLHPP